jgi:hypothetical protein
MGCAVEHDDALGAEDVSAAGVRVIDIRGTRVHPVATPVLADPSGVRARRLARVGRAIAFLGLLWVVGLGLAGIGVLPAGDLPLGRAITGAAHDVLGIAPLPTPSQFAPIGARATSADPTSAATNRLARPRSRPRPSSVDAPHEAIKRQFASSGLRGSPASSTPPGGASRARGQGTSGVPAAAPSGTTAGPARAGATGVQNPGVKNTGRGIANPRAGKIKTAALGSNRAAARASSRTAPGSVRRVGVTVTTAPGQSGSSPGHTVTPSGGHGNGA